MTFRILSALSISLLAAGAPVANAGPHVLQAGKVRAFCDPNWGVARVDLDGNTVWSGATQSFSGYFFTLMRDANVPYAPIDERDRRFVNYLALRRQTPLGTLSPADPHRCTVLHAEPNRYTVRQEFDKGVTLTFDHAMTGQTLTCRVTVENDSVDHFQLSRWMGGRVLFDREPNSLGGTGSNGYPAANVYSPVLAHWDDVRGVGASWIEHRCRRVKFRSDATSSRRPTSDRTFGLEIYNSPVEPGGRTRYALAFRYDTTPGDWRNLLRPYKAWFNAYFGRARYNVDFRMKFMATPSNGGLIKPGNPYGTRNEIDTKGWAGGYSMDFLKTLAEKYPGVASHIVYWSVLASDRGMNYRPESNVFPPVVRETMPILREACRKAKIGFGWFQRPNAIAYRQTWDTDGGVEWNPLNAGHVRMADRRYQDLLDLGCTAFYMDTYGSSAGHSPGSEEACVTYLRHLRELIGPDCFCFIEHGFDAQHVFCPIWPPGGDEHGKRPLGDFARWLTLGTAEICRVQTLEGADRAWREGGMPILQSYMLNDKYVELQKKYVGDDWSSTVRPDCKAVTTSPVPPASLDANTPD